MLLHSQKEYIARIELGKISDTYDVTGNITETRLKHEPTEEEISELIKQDFLGEHVQVPPIFSAKKHNGKRLRDITDNKNIEEIGKSKAKKVTLYDFEIISYAYPYLEIRLSVSSGYYIRKFGSDLGEKLKTGAYLTELKRTKLEEFSVEHALSPDDFTKSIEMRGEVFGNVQGVGFRYFAKELADKLDLTGYAKNNGNGGVELLTQTAPLKKESNPPYPLLKRGLGDLIALTKFQTEIIQLNSGQVLQNPIKISDYKFVIQKSSQIYTNFEIE